MTTETPAANYKIGNERLIRITEKAARKLASLLEEKGKPDGALRLAVVVPACNTSWTSWMGRRSEIFSYRSQMCAWLSTQKALFSSVARCSITVKTSKKGD